MKLSCALGVVIVFLASVLIGCEKTSRMDLSDDNPPSIRLSGTAYFDWLSVQGPLPERMDDSGPSLIWKIVPNDAVPKLDDVPTIVYGQVPDGFHQEVPKSGPPPALIEGKIYGIGVVTRSANHPAKTIVIRNGKAVEYAEGDKTNKEDSDSSPRPIDVSKLTGSRQICFVPLHYDENALKELSTYYKGKYGLDIALKPKLEVEFSRTYDVQRGQHIAQEFIVALKGKYGETGTDSNVVYIGFQPQDMYVKGENWLYVYTYNEDRFAIISNSRLSVFASDSLAKIRLRKLVTRTIGLLYYHLALTDNPKSVMYRGLRGPDDLDRMSEEFLD